VDLVHLTLNDLHYYHYGPSGPPHYLSSYLTYEFKDLSGGFKYLGVFLKLDNYRAEDWGWLIEKFESRINHWCNIMLSLGGRYILIKSILESLPIYWLAITHLPLSVLTKIRQLSFSFLWASQKKSFRYHLCRWELVSKPKLFGGWGLRNLNIFYQALATNTFWRVLTKPRHMEQGDKRQIFTLCSGHSWLRSTSTRTLFGSQTWKNLTNTFSLVLHWLAWNPGIGHSIVIGRDVILGMGKDSLLSDELIEKLNSKSIFLLYQASCPQVQGTIRANWLSSTDLELEGDMATEWETFRKNLKSSGILLQNHPDTLLWMGGDNSGILSVNNVYNAIATKFWSPRVFGWRRNFWKWECPLKIKLFTWLVVENKILSWKNLQKRGWVGPGICSLCKQSNESGKHIFIKCSFC
jgi:hypothetical protein